MWGLFCCKDYLAEVPEMVMGFKCNSGGTGPSKCPKLIIWKLPTMRDGRGLKIMADLAAGVLRGNPLHPCRTVAILSLHYYKCRKNRIIRGVWSSCWIFWPPVHSRGHLPVFQNLETRPESRITSGSMLVRSELRDVERSAICSGTYWRRIIRASASS